MVKSARQAANGELDSIRAVFFSSLFMLLKLMKPALRIQNGVAGRTGSRGQGGIYHEG